MKKGKRFSEQVNVLDQNANKWKKRNKLYNLGSFICS